MYKGRYVHTITAEDVTNPLSIHKRTNGTVDTMRLLNTMGRLLPCDIGKQVYEQTSPSGYVFYQVENDEQMQKRLSKV